MPVARYLPAAEAHPLAGRLESEGIDAKVVRQPQSFYAYHQSGGAAVFMVLVPERDAARAVWILERLAAEGGYPSGEGP